METNYEKAKTELIAIYRLEFYKNKKNWKLCQDVRKNRSRPQKSKSKLFNETYDVEPDIESEQVSPLNQAFMHEQPVDEPHFQDQPQIQLEAPAQDSGQCHHTWTDQLWAEQAPCEDEQQEWCGEEAEGEPGGLAELAELAYHDQCDGPPLHHAHHPMWPQVASEHCPALEALEALSPAELLRLADGWRGAGAACCDPYAVLHQMEDNDSADFERGAHAVPHSSETDLNVSHEECECLSSSELRSAPARRLARAVGLHAAALRRLLLEHALRDQLRPQSSLHPPLPLDDYPTRDTDPLHPPDYLLAGSHLCGPHLPCPQLSCPHMSRPSPPRAAPGRGRGRLRQADRIIGIDLGRPYRL